MLAREFRYSFKGPLPRNSFSHPFFSIRYQKNTNAHYRAAVVVSKKVDTRATIRNDLKRKMIQILTTLFEGKDVSYDMVFFLKKEIIEKEITEIQQEVEKTVQRLGMVSS